MAVRNGMSNLIQRMRALTHSGTADYTAGTVTYWTDQQIQDVLDRYSYKMEHFQLRAEPEWLAGGTEVYHNYWLPIGNLEEAASGTLYWKVEDGDGDDPGTANYTVDYNRGLVRFTADQDGTAYYVRAYSYDVNAAAIGVWQEKMAWRANAIDFAADDQEFSQSQWMKHCQMMISQIGALGGIKTVLIERADM